MSGTTEAAEAAETAEAAEAAEAAEVGPVLSRVHFATSLCLLGLHIDCFSVHFVAVLF